MIDMIVCPQCGARLADVPSLAGRRVSCPSCRHTFPLPPAPPVAALPVVLALRVLERSSISVKELLAFVSPLPNRNVILRYPDGSAGSWRLNDLKKDLKRLPNDSALQSPDGHYFVFRARS